MSQITSGAFGRTAVPLPLAAAGLFFGAGAAPAPPYRDPALPVDARIALDAARRVIPGTFDVMVGTSSESLTKVTLEVTKEP
jgi:hypothetical protein